jgi:hypothetical protein
MLWSDFVTRIARVNPMAEDGRRNDCKCSAQNLKSTVENEDDRDDFK